MKNKVQNFIVEKSLFSREDKLILGISGGADSVCLMHILLALGYRFDLAHCNFNLRGKESDEDEVFVQELAKKHQLKLHVKQFDTEGYAAENKISTQMAARDLRYAWFNHLLLTKNAKYIAIAHHENDDIETFFINLIRGSGLKGLLGISEKTNSIVRPLMAITRDEIESYLDENKLRYRDDSSNSSVKYLRNKIRHELMPLLAEMNPSIQQTISEKMRILEGVSQVYSCKIEEVRKDLMQEKNGIVQFETSDLLALKPLHNYLYELLSPYGFVTIDAIAKALKGQSGKQFFSNTHQLLVDREFIFISELDVKKNESITIEEMTKEIKHPIQLNFSKTDNLEWIKNKNIAQLDYDKLQFPLTLRKWKKGDKFMPLGMQTFKKLSDFFIDNKFSILDKNKQWLLCSNNDIVWVVGHRIDERYKLQSKTKKVYIAQI
ncbi:MAG: tRNA lysidine(34) synthetase TilS [Flavobacteriales bacterium]|nr:tRNA lysidine(34) synthetase TilS [Flavobacteriales bacterium]